MEVVLLVATHCLCVGSVGDAHLPRSWSRGDRWRRTGSGQPTPAPTPPPPPPLASQGIDMVTDSSSTHAYVCDLVAGLRVVDVTDPADPVVVFTDGEPCTTPKVAGSSTLYTSHTTGIKRFDISNPTDPILRGVYPNSGYGLDLAVVGDYVLVAEGAPGLLVLDFSSLGSPEMVGGLQLTCTGVAVDGDFAYLSAHLDGLVVVDITDMTSLLEVTRYATPGVAQHVTVANNVAYVSDTRGGLEVVDVGEADTPTLVVRHRTEGEEVLRAFATGTHVFIVTQGEGEGGGEATTSLHTACTTSLPALSIEDTITTSTGAKGVAVLGSAVYYTDVGLHVLQRPDLVTSPPSVDTEARHAALLSNDTTAEAAAPNDDDTPEPTAVPEPEPTPPPVTPLPQGPTIGSLAVRRFEQEVLLRETEATAEERQTLITDLGVGMVYKYQRNTEDVQGTATRKGSVLQNLEYDYLVWCDGGSCADKEDAFVRLGWYYERRVVDSLDYPQYFEKEEVPEYVEMDVILEADGCSKEAPTILTYKVPLGVCGPLIPVGDVSTLALWAPQGGVLCDLKSETRVLMMSPDHAAVDQGLCTRALEAAGRGDSFADYPELVELEEYVAREAEDGVCFPTEFSGGAVLRASESNRRCVQYVGYEIEKSDGDEAETLLSGVAAGAASTAGSVAAAGASIGIGDFSSVKVRKIRGRYGQEANHLLLRWFKEGSAAAVVMMVLGTLLAVVGYAQYWSEDGGDLFVLLNGHYWWFLGVQGAACVAAVLYRLRLLPHPTGVVLVVGVTVAAFPMAELVAHHALRVSLSIRRGNGCQLAGCTGPPSDTLADGIALAAAGAMIAAIADIVLAIFACCVVEGKEDPLREEGEEDGNAGSDEEDVKSEVSGQQQDQGDLSSTDGGVPNPGGSDVTSNEPYACGTPDPLARGAFWKKTPQYKLLLHGGAWVAVLGAAELAVWVVVWLDMDGWCRSSVERQRAVMHWWYGLVILVGGCFMYRSATDVRGSWEKDRFLPVVLAAVSVGQLMHAVATGERLKALYGEEESELWPNVLVVLSAASAGILAVVAVLLVLTPDDPEVDVREAAHARHLALLEQQGKAYKPGIVTHCREWMARNEVLMRKVFFITSSVSLALSLYTFVVFEKVVIETKGTMLPAEASAYRDDAALVSWLNFFQVVVSLTMMALCASDRLKTHHGVLLALTLVAMTHAPITAERTAELAQYYAGGTPVCNVTTLALP